MQLILASNSPRRRELLAEYGYKFKVEPSLFEERAEGLSAYETAAYFAQSKAEEVLARFPDALVLGADTVVVLDGKILGKPKDGADAVRMLRLLSGRAHAVLTGVSVAKSGYVCTKIAETRVVFHDLSEELIGRYVASGSPLDKAGAYGIQDGYPLVKSYEGSYTNVVGLPVELVQEMLAEAGGTI